MNNNTELLELQDRYNRICNELKQLISSVLESGKKTPEEAVRLSQLQEEEQILYAELKQLGLLSNQLDKKAIIRNAIILVSVLVVIAVIITILFNIW